MTQSAVQKEPGYYLKMEHTTNCKFSCILHLISFSLRIAQNMAEKHTSNCWRQAVGNRRCKTVLGQREQLSCCCFQTAFCSFPRFGLRHSPIRNDLKSSLSINTRVQGPTLILPAQSVLGLCHFLLVCSLFVFCSDLIFGSDCCCIAFCPLPLLPHHVLHCSSLITLSGGSFGAR